MTFRARLYLKRSGQSLYVEVQATQRASRALRPFASFLRAQPPWAEGSGALIVSIADTAIVADAFRPGTQFTSWKDVVALAGIDWFLPSEFRGGELHQAEWLAFVGTRLDEHLKQLAKECPTLPFPGEDDN